MLVKNFPFIREFWYFRYLEQTTEAVRNSMSNIAGMTQRCGHVLPFKTETTEHFKTSARFILLLLLLIFHLANTAIPLVILTGTCPKQNIRKMTGSMVNGKGFSY